MKYKVNNSSCLKSITLELVRDRVSYCIFEGGCQSNLKAISKLIIGMNKDKVVELFENNKCFNRKFSCTQSLVEIIKSLEIVKE